MLQNLKLFLPILIPSWRFFDVIAPAPRIEFCALQSTTDTPQNWREYRPRPDHLSLKNFVRRMVWNARWNESLFMMSLAERLMKGDETFARGEIFKRLERDVAGEKFIRFRLVFHAREGNEVQKHEVYLSPVHPVPCEAVS